MKKLLVMIPTLGGGGAEKILITLLNNLNSKKYEITVFSIFDYGENKFFLNSNIEYKFLFKNIFRGNIHLFKLFTPKLLYKYIIKQKYDIIISYLEGPTTRIISGCDNPKTKLINWVHTDATVSKIFTKSYRNKDELIRCYKKYDSTVFISEQSFQSFYNKFGQMNNMIIKYNPIDSEKIIKKSKEKIIDININKQKFNIISIGRFSSVKGFERLFKIMYFLKKEKLNIHLYLLGKGELEEKYKKIIKNLGIEEDVTFLGYKDNPYKYLKICDLYVCSSYREGYSTSIAESLIVGIPIITTDCSGMKELLGNNEFGIITSNNENSLYQEIKRIIENRKILDYYKVKSLERGALFSLKNTIEEIEKIL